MPIEMNLWRIEEDRPRSLIGGGIGEEARLESIIADDVTILGLGPLMLLGRQVPTDYGGYIDLLALDEEGTLYVIELKRSRTPRDVVAQVLDYASWARGVSAERLARMFESGTFARNHTFHAAFADQFDGPPPETINENHRLVIVASNIDDSTQRIVEYLLEEHGVPVNVVFFRYFRDGDSEYLGRSWLEDPEVAEERARAREPKRTPGEWNGTDYYVRFGFGDYDRRSWEDARQWCYVSAGGGSRWTGPIETLLCAPRQRALLGTVRTLCGHRMDRSQALLWAESATSDLVHRPRRAADDLQLALVSRSATLRLRCGVQ